MKRTSTVNQALKCNQSTGAHLNLEKHTNKPKQEMRTLQRGATCRELYCSVNGPSPQSVHSYTIRHISGIIRYIQPQYRLYCAINVPSLQSMYCYTIRHISTINRYTQLFLYSPSFSVLYFRCVGQCLQNGSVYFQS